MSRILVLVKQKTLLREFTHFESRGFIINTPDDFVPPSVGHTMICFKNWSPKLKEMFCFEKKDQYGVCTESQEIISITSVQPDFDLTDIEERI